jgi:hypothetical protein
MNYFRKQNADVKTGWLDTEIDTGTGLLEMTSDTAAHGRTWTKYRFNLRLARTTVYIWA